MQLPTISPFWAGVVASPFIILAVWFALFLLGRAYSKIKPFFWGMPVINYLGMLFILLGLCLVRVKNKYVSFRTLDGRIWMSPHVKAFTTREDV
jgi:hypothetical protein